MYNPNKKELILKAIDIVNSDVIQGATSFIIKRAANNNIELFLEFLENISEQAWDPETYDSAVKTYSKELIDISKEIFPPKSDYPFLKINEDKIKGGLSDKLTLKDIGKKFKVKLEDLEKELKMGIEVETEHTKDKNKAKEIAMDHLTEFPDYYTRIKKMEKSADKKWGSIKEFIKTNLRESLKNKA